MVFDLCTQLSLVTQGRFVQSFISGMGLDWSKSALTTPSPLLVIIPGGRERTAHTYGSLATTGPLGNPGTPVDQIRLKERTFSSRLEESFCLLLTEYE